MQKFELKTFSPKNQKSQFEFYILNKGKNSGKPLDEPCTNCYVLSTNSEEEKQFFKTLCDGLFKSKSYYNYLKGSVILFVTINDCKSIIKNGLIQANANLPQFKKSVKAIKELEQKERQYLETLQLISEAKRIILYRYIKSR